MHRSEITIDLGAIRHNARRLLEALDGAELWAVVKANGYGHGATDVARAALEPGPPAPWRRHCPRSAPAAQRVPRAADRRHVPYGGRGRGAGGTSRARRLGRRDP